MNAFLAKIANEIISKFAPNLEIAIGIAPMVCCNQNQIDDDAELEWMFAEWEKENPDAQTFWYIDEAARETAEAEDYIAYGFDGEHEWKQIEKDIEHFIDFTDGERAGSSDYPRYRFDLCAGKTDAFKEGYASGWINRALSTTKAQTSVQCSDCGQFVHTHNIDANGRCGECFAAAFAKDGDDAFPF